MIVAVGFPFPGSYPATRAPFQFQTELAKGLFQLADLNRSGGVSQYELQSLNSYLSNRLATSRFANPTDYYNYSGLNNMFSETLNVFQAMDTDRNGEISYQNQYPYYGMQYRHISSFPSYGSSEIDQAAAADGDPFTFSNYDTQLLVQPPPIQPPPTSTPPDLMALLQQFINGPQATPPPVSTPPSQPDLNTLLQLFLGQNTQV